MFKIAIPKPCHADWNVMTLTQQGAFCGSCNKEVVDFTQMTDEQVRNYFIGNSQNKTCGHFRTDQIHRIRISLPDTIFIQKIASWKRFMAVLLLAFGSMLFGCDVRTDKNKNGETVIQNKIEAPSKLDITFEKGEPYLAPPLDVPPLLGTVALFIPDSSTCKKQQLNESSTIDGNIELIQIGTINSRNDTIDYTDYDKVFTGNVLLEKSDKIIDTSNKKPASDTDKCKDPGYY